MAYGAKPPELYPYGAKISQCATLVFDIELLKIDGREENEASIENIPQLIFHGPYALALLGFPAVTYGHW